MKNNMPRPILLFVLGLLSCVSGAVVELTDGNFDQHIDGSSHALVEFFAPWYIMQFFMAYIDFFPLSCSFVNLSSRPGGISWSLLLC